MVSGRSVKCNAIFPVYDLSALGFETLLFGMFLNNMYYSQKELSQEIASDTKQSRLLSLSQESST